MQVWLSYPNLSRDMQVSKFYPNLSWIIPIYKIYTVTWISRDFMTCPEAGGVIFPDTLMA